MGASSIPQTVAISMTDGKLSRKNPRCPETLNYMCSREGECGDDCGIPNFLRVPSLQTLKSSRRASKEDKLSVMMANVVPLAVRANPYGDT